MPTLPVRIRALAVIAAVPILLPALSQLPRIGGEGAPYAFAIAGAVFTILMGVAYVAFWVAGPTGHRGQILAALVVLLTVGSAINRGAPTYTAF